VQNLREVGGTELGGSTRGFNLLRQAHDLFLFEKHDTITVVRTMGEFNALMLSSRPSALTLAGGCRRS